MRRYKDRESFIKLANILHNNFYDYSEFVYGGKNTEGIIICPIHGPFKQTPNIHVRAIRPSGCPHCSIENKIIPFEEFVSRARKIHGNDYVYKEEDYVDMKTPMDMYCTIHKHVFKQSPNNHVHKTNPTKCPICAAEIVISKNRKPFNKFVADARKVHGDNYEYDEKSYVNAIIPINIFCNKCGKWFKQKPHDHLSGSGCNKCNSSIMEERMMVLMDKMSIKYHHWHTFEWLIYKKHQFLDFYLEDYKVAIECQDEQHFMPVDFSHKKNLKEASSRFQLNQKRDENKRKLCEQHGIKLYYINYNEKLEDRFNEIYKEIIG